MPTYEYKCETCGGRFEIFESIKSDARTTCPEELCQSERESERGTGRVRRVVSGGAGVLFKGEGFYVTDYVRKGSSEGSKGDSSSSGSSKESGESSGSSTSDSSKGSDSSTISSSGQQPA